MNEVEIKKYEAIVEAILFTMGDAVEVDKIAYAIGHDVDTTKKLIANLIDKYEAEMLNAEIVTENFSPKLLPDYTNNKKSTQK